MRRETWLSPLAHSWFVVVLQKCWQENTLFREAFIEACITAGGPLRDAHRAGDVPVKCFSLILQRRCYEFDAVMLHVEPELNL